MNGTLERRTRPASTGGQHRRVRLLSRLRSRRLAVRSAITAVAAAGALAGLGAAPAAASTSYYGSSVSAWGVSSSINHVLTVTPQVSPMSGFASQTVYYRVFSTDVTTNTTRTFGWYGPYTVRPVTIPPTNCNELTQTGCVSITYPSTTLPKTTLSGPAGHAFKLSVQVAYGASNGWWYGPSTLIENCRNYYQTNGIANSVLGNLCFT